MQTSTHRPFLHRPLLRNQRGQGLIEYLILVALIAVGTIASVRILGQSLNVKFAKVAESLGADVQSDIGNATVTSGSWKKKDLRDFMQGSSTRGNGGSRGQD